MSQVIGVVGSGNLARALVRGWREPVLVSDSGSGSAAALAAEVGGQRAESNTDLGRVADIVVLCHKPQQLELVAEEIAADAKTVISALARVTIAELQDAYPNCEVARVMPSIAAELRQGLTVIADAGAAKNEARRLFARVGETVVVDEGQLDAATAIGGVGPAYAALIVEAWSEAGVKHGLDRAQAVKMAVASLAGGAALIAARDDDAAAVRHAVSSPGGVTLKGLAALEAAGIRRAFEDASDAVTSK